MLLPPFLDALLRSLDVERALLRVHPAVVLIHAVEKPLGVVTPMSARALLQQVVTELAAHLARDLLAQHRRPIRDRLHPVAEMPHERLGIIETRQASELSLGVERIGQQRARPLDIERIRVLDRAHLQIDAGSAKLGGEECPPFLGAQGSTRLRFGIAEPVIEGLPVRFGVQITLRSQIRVEGLGRQFKRRRRRARLILGELVALLLLGLSYDEEVMTEGGQPPTQSLSASPVRRGQPLRTVDGGRLLGEHDGNLHRLRYP